MKKWTLENMENQKGKQVIVTGANSGIGFEEAKGLAINGASVILACRNEEKGNEAVELIKKSFEKANIKFMKLDLSSLNSVREFAENFNKNYEKLDILINNAGVMMPPFSRTKEGFELQFGTNHLGHFLLTGLLFKKIDKSEGRIVNVSSVAGKMGSIDYNDINYEKKDYKKMEAYCQSKAANLVFTKELNEKIFMNGSKVKVFSSHPGWTSTNLQRHFGAIKLLNPFFGMKPKQGALPTLYAAVSKNTKSGKFYGPNGFKEMKGYPTEVPIVTKKNKSAFDEKIKFKLWELSEKMTNFKWKF